MNRKKKKIIAYSYHIAHLILQSAPIIHNAIVILMVIIIMIIIVVLIL